MRPAGWTGFPVGCRLASAGGVVVTIWLVVGLVLAIWRVTRLLVVDTLPAVRVVREWFISTFGVVSEDGEVVAGRGYRWPPT